MSQRIPDDDPSKHMAVAGDALRDEPRQVRALRAGTYENSFPTSAEEPGMGAMRLPTLRMVVVSPANNTAAGAPRASVVGADRDVTGVTEPSNHSGRRSPWTGVTSGGSRRRRRGG